LSSALLFVVPLLFVIPFVCHSFVVIPAGNLRLPSSTNSKSA